jgi:hypothetical protein
MATVNFSVPDGVKEEFNRTFDGENKSALVARLMRQAVEERRCQRRRSAAVNALLGLRAEQLPASDDVIAEARRTARP